MHKLSIKAKKILAWITGAFCVLGWLSTTLGLWDNFKWVTVPSFSGLLRSSSPDDWQKFSAFLFNNIKNKVKLDVVLVDDYFVSQSEYNNHLADRTMDMRDGYDWFELDGETYNEMRITISDGDFFYHTSFVTTYDSKYESTYIRRNTGWCSEYIEPCGRDRKTGKVCIEDYEESECRYVIIKGFFEFDTITGLNGITRHRFEYRELPE
ncbi:hypothetical protein [Photobacterium kasasachensis]|uniref:hypothetical protein n=1 Tax=Photobacterium kasasachensis TaxID=2910240 RepID=UPI003D1034E1